VLLLNKRLPLHTHRIQRRTTARWEVLRDAFGQGSAERVHYIYHALLIPEARGMAANVPMANAGGPPTRTVRERGGPLCTSNSRPQVTPRSCQIFPGEINRMFIE
jgi:hypothetical protein